MFRKVLTTEGELFDEAFSSPGPMGFAFGLC